jgi:RNA polymerase sigma-70 factor (ECF subfamily)
MRYVEVVSEVRQQIVEQIPHLRRYARALVGDRIRADDLVQDCLERAWSRIHLWKAGTNIRAWLFTILHNVYLNTARRHRNMPALTPIDGGSADPPARATQEDGLEVRSVWQAFSRLPDTQRAAILLIALEEMSYEEAAVVLDIPVGTLMSRIHRGRERLRGLMSDAGGDGTGGSE